MSSTVAPPTGSARERRREQTTAEILDAAWGLCREGGLASLSLRELAGRVGMRAPSLYSYFDSKQAIYDAMFSQGYRELRAHMEPFTDLRPITRAEMKEGVRHWVAFCTADEVRYQLLFQRTIPGFEPSPESYALALEHLGEARQVLVDAGVTDESALDLWTAVLTGLTSQQISNDPGGDRWSGLVDESVDMFLDHLGVLPENQPTENQPTENQPTDSQEESP